MDRYEIAGLQTLTEDDHAGRVEAYLQSVGIQTAGVSVGWADGAPTVWVTSDTDPTKALQSYVPTLTPEEQERADALADAQTAIDAISAKSRTQRTATEKVLLGLAVGSDAVRVSRSIDKQAPPAERR